MSLDHLREKPYTEDQLARIRMLSFKEPMPHGSVTCDKCSDRYACRSTMDPYNTSGDCLEAK